MGFAGSRPPWLRRTVSVLVAVVAVPLLMALYAAPRLLPLRGEALVLSDRERAGGLQPHEGDVQPDASGWLLRWRAGAAAPTVVAALPNGDAPRFLTYRFASVPKTLRLVAGWRRADQPDRWFWAPLPFPAGTTTVDMVRLSKEWRGVVGELRISALPAELLPAGVPAHAGALLSHLSLQSDAYLPAWAALFDEWFAYRPWSGRSINTGSFSLRFEQPRPVTPFVLGLVVLFAGWAALRRGSPGAARAWPRRALVVLAVGWLALDALQLRTLSLRAAHVAALSDAAAGDLLLEPTSAAQVQAVLGHPALQDPATRLLVVTPSEFHRAWLPFLLLPRNVAAADPVQVQGVPAGSLVLALAGAGTLEGDRWLLDGAVLHVEVLQRSGRTALLRVRGAGQ